MLTNEYKKLLKDLSLIIPPEQLISDELLNYAYAVDASFYSLIPKLTVVVENEAEAVCVIKACHNSNIPYTFRAAGTSLSGQAVSDSVLIKLGPGWNKMDITDNGHLVTLQPAITGGEVNRRLFPYNKKLGPDPASANVAKIGGILANNASGMTSGVVHNSYNTMVGMRIVFFDGSVLDTRDRLSVENFKKVHKDIVDQIKSLAVLVKTNKKLQDRIRFKYKIKNTCGYGLNSFTDFTDPVDIIAHLFIGSEGTLGFISEVTMQTVDNFPHKASTFLLFHNLEHACQAITILEKARVDCAELMDSAALFSIKDMPGIPFDTRRLTAETSALLVEISAETESQLRSKQTGLIESMASLELVNEARFTLDPLERARIWKIRKGLFPTGCKTREKGTTVIIEDINFPVDKLAPAVKEIQSLLKEYGYHNSFIWGHALAGNIHFVLTQKFDTREKTENYNNFMQQLAKLVIDRYDGSLKAEHGTGRNMAPFVAYEWGGEAYSIMQQVKKIFDPGGIINPGVLLNDDPLVHLKNLKSISAVHDKIDMCTECGFCEKICPSKNFTITPRQRISLFRKEMSAGNFNAKTLKKLSGKFRFNVDQSCAADGMCQTECPVDINVGEIVKEVRSLQKSSLNNFLASGVAANFKTVITVARFALAAAEYVRKITGSSLLAALSRIMSVASFGLLPVWQLSLPVAAKKIKQQGAMVGHQAIYFPSCINRIFGSYAYSKKTELADVIGRVASQAGLPVKVLQEADHLCCGMAFASKGYLVQSREMSEKLYQALKREMAAEPMPVLFDTSPCAIHFQDYLREQGKEDIEIYEPSDFIYRFIKDKVRLEKVVETVAVHTVCSVKRKNNSHHLNEIVRLCSENVVTSEPLGCCGFAGDKGIQIPGLKKAAMGDLQPGQFTKCSGGYSTSRMCEIGLTGETNVEFNSVFYLLEKSMKK